MIEAIVILCYHYDMKRCNRCDLDKELDRFTKDKSTKDGLSRWCKDCKALSDKRYRTGPGGFKRDDSIVKEIDAKLFVNGKVGRGSSKKRSEEDRLVARGGYAQKLPQYNYTKRLNKYNMTEKEHIEILERQNYTCAICPETVTLQSDIDHCHVSLIVRGILCPSCNKGLGFFKDSVENLESAAKYLKYTYLPRVTLES